MDLNPLALSEILQKNAKDLTDAEIDQLIAGLRAERERGSCRQAREGVSDQRRRPQSQRRKPYARKSWLD